MGNPALILVLPKRLRSVSRLRSTFVRCRGVVFGPDVLVPQRGSIATASFLLPLVDKGIAIPAVFAPICPCCASIVVPVSTYSRVDGAGPRNCRLCVGDRLCRFFFVLSGHYQGLAANDGHGALSGVGVILGCVRGGCVRGVAVTSVTTAISFSRSRFVQCFGRAVKASFISCLQSCHLAVTSHLLAASSSSVLSVTTRSNFRGLSCFGQIFGRGCDVAPHRFQGRDRWFFQRDQ